jgi:hypothetical protein
MKLLIYLDKYSDLFEAYSCIEFYSPADIKVIFLNNQRNSQDSVSSFLNNISSLKDSSISFYPCDTREQTLSVTDSLFLEMCSGDIFCAPFIRYHSIWTFVRLARDRQIKTVHLSETLPDTFGLLGYRLGFRGRSLKSWLSSPLAVMYARMNKPDLCFFPMMPEIANPFVKDSRQASIPPLANEKLYHLKSIITDEPRTLLISGFGYDHFNMASASGCKRWIATSKNKEIFIDGNRVELPYHVTAEEVLMLKRPPRLISYTGTAVVWAKRIYPGLDIECYKASGLDYQYGSLYSVMASRSLNKIGIKVLPENKAIWVGV